jgi:CheY-like chemotaxis protein
VLASITDAPINILIVDDEPKNLAVLETLLDRPDIASCAPSQPTRRCCHSLPRNFALLILDIRMPGMTGSELAQIDQGSQEDGADSDHFPDGLLQRRPARPRRLRQRRG